MQRVINRKNLIKVIPAFLAISVSSALNAADVSVEVQENIDQLIKTNQCVGCNLTGADLNRLNLSGADLSQADLTDASFYLADLSEANLTGSVLRGAKFGGADLADADLRGADLRGAMISGAYTAGSKMDGSLMQVSGSQDNVSQDAGQKVYIPDDSTPKESPEKKKVAIAKRRDFGAVPPAMEGIQKESDVPAAAGPAKMQANQNTPAVKRITPVGHLTIDNNSEQQTENPETDNGLSRETTKKETRETVVAQTSTPKNINVPETNEAAEGKNHFEMVTSSTNKGIDLRDNPVPQEELLPENKPVVRTDSQALETEDQNVTTDSPVSVENQDFESKEIVKTDESVVDAFEEDSPEKKFLNQELPVDPKIILIDKLLDTDKCYQCDFAGANLAGENLEDADLEGSDFSGANLEGTDFQDANLKGVLFKNANLRNADFKGADLYKADFSGADVTGADFSKSELDEVNFSGAQGYQINIVAEEQQ